MYSSKTKCIPYERTMCAQERAHMRAACLPQTRALSTFKYHTGLLKEIICNLRNSPYRRNV